MKIQKERQHQAPSRGNGSSFRRAKPLVAGVATFALGFSGVALTAGAAHAAPGSSQASARYLSGTLLGTSLDSVAGVLGETAEANADTSEVVTNSGDLELSVLGELIELQVADGITIPVSFTDAGAVGQYASASQSGDSNAGAGLITDQGVIDTTGSEDAPGELTLDLTQLVGAEFTDEIVDLELSSEINSASAEALASGEASGDYLLGDLSMAVNSPVVSELSGAILESGPAINDAAAALVGPDGSLVSGLTDAVSGLGVVDLDASLDLDVQPILADVLGANQLLGAGGPVELNLATGDVTVDIDALLQANGRDLNDLAPGEEILNTELVGYVTAEIDELVNGLLAEAQEAVATALASSALTVDITVGDPVDPVLTLALDGSLGAIESGEVVPEVVILGVDFDAGILNALVATAVTEVLELQIDASALDLELTGLYPALDAVISDVVSLQGNVQETEGGEFTQTALRLSALNFTDPAGEALELNLAQASVGPNVAETPDGPGEEEGTFAFTPTQGPEAGGTSVTFTGEALDEVTEVNFGNVPATSFTLTGANELIAVTPAGVGPVAVTLERGATSETASTPFTYIGDGDVTGEVTTVTPTAGPEAGGTFVTIGGSGFENISSVTFDGTPGTSFTVNSDSEITVVTPPGTGVADIVLVGNTPAETIDAAQDFTYIADGGPGDGTDAPDIDTVTPNSGSTDGGTTVVIEGDNLTDITNVFFGDNEATDVVVTENEITATTPAGSVGAVDVTVTEADGSGDAIEDGFTYFDSPVASGNGDGSGNGSSGAGAGGDSGPRQERLVSTGAEANHGAIASAILMILGGIGAFVAGRRKFFA